MTFRALAIHAALRVALIAAALLAKPAHAQQYVDPQPDCAIPFGNQTAAGSQPSNGTGAASGGPGLDNRLVGCTIWIITYSVSGLSSATLTLQSAPDAGGVPGTWVTYAGQDVTSGANPSTTTTGNATLCALTGYNAWVRVLFSSLSGSGVVVGAAYGWRSTESAVWSAPAYLLAGAGLRLTQMNGLPQSAQYTSPAFRAGVPVLTRLGPGFGSRRSTRQYWTVAVPVTQREMYRSLPHTRLCVSPSTPTPARQQSITPEAA